MVRSSSELDIDVFNETRDSAPSRHTPPNVYRGWKLFILSRVRSFKAMLESTRVLEERWRWETVLEARCKQDRCSRTFRIAEDERTFIFIRRTTKSYPHFRFILILIFIVT